MGFEPQGATREEKSQHAAEFLDGVHADLKAVTVAAQALGYKPKSSIATTNAIHAARHILNRAKEAGYQATGNVGEDLKGAAAFLHGKMRSEPQADEEIPEAEAVDEGTSKATAFADSLGPLLVGLVAATLGGPVGCFIAPMLRQLLKTALPSGEEHPQRKPSKPASKAKGRPDAAAKNGAATDALLDLSNRLGLRPLLSPPPSLSGRAKPVEKPVKQPEPSPKPTKRPAEQPDSRPDAPPQSPATPEPPQPRVISAAPSATPPATAPPEKQKGRELSNKQLLDAAILDAVGTEDAETQSGFRKLVDEVWKRKQEYLGAREKAKAHARRTLNLNAGDINRLENQGFDSGGGHKKIGALDTVGRELAAMYPELGWGQGYTTEAAHADKTNYGDLVWPLIREGARPLPAKHSPEVIGEALGMFAAMEGAHAARANGEDVSFWDDEAEEMASDDEPEGWREMTEEERIAADPEYVPFAKWAEGMRSRKYLADDMRQKYQKARGQQDWLLAKIYRAAMEQAVDECEQYAKKKPKYDPAQTSLGWTEEDEKKHPRDEGGKFSSKDVGDSSVAPKSVGESSGITREQLMNQGFNIDTQALRGHPLEQDAIRRKIGLAKALNAVEYLMSDAYLADRKRLGELEKPKQVDEQVAAETARVLDRSYDAQVWDAINKHIDSGSPIRISTRQKTWNVGPDNRAALRFHNGELQVYEGKRKGKPLWSTIKFDALDNLAARLGVDKPPPDTSALEAEQAVEQAKHARWWQIVNEHFGGDEEAANQAHFDSEFSAAQQDEFIADWKAASASDAAKPEYQPHANAKSDEAYNRILHEAKENGLTRKKVREALFAEKDDELWSRRDEMMDELGFERTNESAAREQKHHEEIKREADAAAQRHATEVEQKRRELEIAKAKAEAERKSQIAAELEADKDIEPDWTGYRTIMGGFHAWLEYKDASRHRDIGDVVAYRRPAEEHEEFIEEHLRNSGALTQDVWASVKRSGRATEKQKKVIAIGIAKAIAKHNMEDARFARVDGQ
jgi:DNA-binding transcriptional MerR regulator